MSTLREHTGFGEQLGVTINPMSIVFGGWVGGRVIGWNVFCRRGSLVSVSDSILIGVVLQVRDSRDAIRAVLRVKHTFDAS